MYGHVFYKNTTEKQVEFLNKELISGEYQTFDELANSIFIDQEDIKAELLGGGYVFVSQLNQFVQGVWEKNDVK